MLAPVGQGVCEGVFVRFQFVFAWATVSSMLSLKPWLLSKEES